MYLSDSRVANISKTFTHKMAAKTGWHRPTYATKWRHGHPMYNAIFPREWNVKHSTYTVSGNAINQSSNNKIDMPHWRSAITNKSIRMIQLSYTNEIVTTFKYVTRAGHLPAPQTHVPPKVTIADICPPYLNDNTNQGVVSAITVFGGGAGVGGTNVRSHVVSRHTRVWR